MRFLVWFVRESCAPAPSASIRFPSRSRSSTASLAFFSRTWNCWKCQSSASRRMRTRSWSEFSDKGMPMSFWDRSAPDPHDAISDEFLEAALDIGLLNLREAAGALSEAERLRCPRRAPTSRANCWSRLGRAGASVPVRLWGSHDDQIDAASLALLKLAAVVTASVAAYGPAILTAPRLSGFSKHSRFNHGRGPGAGLWQRARP